MFESETNPSLTKARPILWGLALTVLFGIYSFLGWGQMWVRVTDLRGFPLGYDFHCIYIPTVDLNLKGMNVFAAGYQQSLTQRFDHYFPVPMHAVAVPPYYLLHAPLAHFRYFDACFIYSVLSPLVFTLMFWLLARRLMGPRFAAAFSLLLALLIPHCGVGQDTMMLGQSSFLTAAALVYLVLFQNHPVSAGLVGLFPILAKIWPGLVFTHFLDPRRYKVALSAVVSFIGLAVLTGSVYGFFIYPDWLARLRSGGIHYEPTNQSLLGVVLRFTEGQHMGALVLINVAAAVIFSLAVRYYCWRKPVHPAHPKLASELVEFSIYLVFSSLFAAWSLPHHHLIFFIPFLAVCSLALDGRDRDVTNASWVTLTLITALWWLDGEVVCRRWVSLLHSIYLLINGVFFQMLLILVFLLVTLVALRRSPRP
ncbi:DUF2029 domain-containing protein [bacterium]|nr:DUF2029 domain-containing protein [bacterium]